MRDMDKRKVWYEKNKERIKAYRKAHYEANKDIAKASAKTWNEKNKEKRTEQRKVWYEKNKEKAKSYELKKYNITIEQYNTMFQAQNGCCAICSKHQNELKKALAVDHDHETGQVRGLLCDVCNRGLGYFRDSEYVSLAAQRYLARYKKAQRLKDMFPDIKTEKTV